MFEDTTVISNFSNTPLPVYFEPWGMDHELLPGHSIQVNAESSQEGELEVVREENQVTVYGWEGSILKAFSGEEVVLDLQPPVPTLPKGMSSKSFIKLMFGGPGEPKAD